MDNHNRKPLAPIPCKCGQVLANKGLQMAHVRKHPECKRTREESRELYRQRWPDRAAVSYANRQRRWRASDKGHARAVRQELARTPDQRRSRAMVQNALDMGRLQRLPCLLCGATPAQGHHHRGYEPGYELDLILAVSDPPFRGSPRAAKHEGRGGMTAQDRFDRAVDAMEHADQPEYDIDPKADAMRIARDGDTYSWNELPDHVRDYWREEASR